MTLLQLPENHLIYSVFPRPRLEAVGKADGFLVGASLLANSRANVIDLTWLFASKLARTRYFTSFYDTLALGERMIQEFSVLQRDALKM